MALVVPKVAMRAPRHAFPRERSRSIAVNLWSSTVLLLRGCALFFFDATAVQRYRGAGYREPQPSAPGATVSARRGHAVNGSKNEQRAPSPHPGPLIADDNLDGPPGSPRPPDMSVIPPIAIRRAVAAPHLADHVLEALRQQLRSPTPVNGPAPAVAPDTLAQSDRPNGHILDDGVAQQFPDLRRSPARARSRALQLTSFSLRAMRSFEACPALDAARWRSTRTVLARRARGRVCRRASRRRHLVGVTSRSSCCFFSLGACSPSRSAWCRCPPGQQPRSSCRPLRAGARALEITPASLPVASAGGSTGERCNARERTHRPR